MFFLIKYEKGAHCGFKIREYRGLDVSDNQKIQTVYYKREGSPKRSSQSHELRNVEGIVRMKFTA